MSSAIVIIKQTEFIEQTFNREGSLYLACNDKMPFFFTSEQFKQYKLWSCQKMCDALNYLLDNIFIRFGSKLYRQTVGIPMGTYCAPLVADLFLFCYERDLMLFLSDNNQTGIIEAFNSTSRYLDDLLDIDNPHFEPMLGQIYPTELQLNNANSSDTEAPFLDLNLSITNGVVSSKIHDKRDDFNFEIVNFPFLDGDVPCSPSYGVYLRNLLTHTVNNLLQKLSYVKRIQNFDVKQIFHIIHHCQRPEAFYQILTCLI